MQEEIFGPVLTIYVYPEAEYKETMSLDDAVLLALKCMSKVLEDKIDAQKIRIALIPSATKKFTRLAPADVDKYLKKLESAKKAGAK